MLKFLVQHFWCRTRHTSEHRCHVTPLSASASIPSILPPLPVQSNRVSYRARGDILPRRIIPCHAARSIRISDACVKHAIWILMGQVVVNDCETELRVLHFHLLGCKCARNWRKRINFFCFHFGTINAKPSCCRRPTTRKRINHSLSTRIARRSYFQFVLISIEGINRLLSQADESLENVHHRLNTD